VDKKSRQGVVMLSKLITIGTDCDGATLGDAVRLDPDELIYSRAVIQGNSGAGKSWMLRLFIEQMGEHYPFIVLDPEGEFASLREKFDLILVGSEGEIPAEVISAGLLARKLMELRVSAVVDLFELKHQRRREFARDFLTALVELPRELWGETLVCVDEAQMFCPEKGQGEAVSTEAVIDLMTLGRKRGLCGVLASQRFSKLNNNAIAEANNIFIGRTWLDADVRRAASYLGLTTAEDKRGMGTLEKGEFYAFGPAFERPGVHRFITEAVETTHPKRAQKAKLKPPKASEAIKEIVRGLEDLPRQAKEEKLTLERAAERIGELEGEVRKLTRDVECAEQAGRPEPFPIFTEEEQQRLLTAVRQLSELTASLAGASYDINQASERIEEAVKGAAALRNGHSRSLPPIRTEPPSARRTDALPPQSPPSRDVPTRRRSDDAGAQHVKAGGRRMLDALARYQWRGGLTREELSTLAFVTKGGTFSSYLSALSTNGYVVEGERVEITREGLDYLRELNPTYKTTPYSTEEIVGGWLGGLKAGARRMVELLIEAYPAGLTRDELSKTSGVTKGGTFSSYLSSIATKGLCEERGKTVHAADVLFMEREYRRR
jgi:uncharacterized protein